MEEFVAKRVGQVLGERWRLEAVLGVGGMAAVYAARDRAGTEVAVKILHPEIGMRPELRDRFMREGYLANRIQHSGVVRVLEHGAVDDWSVFLVMERLQGESLGERVSRQGTLSEAELLYVLDQVLEVLAVAHESGIVHRDLKPDNLFWTTAGAIKVLDFGIARVLESAPHDVRTRTGLAMGTLPFMAPEQALGRRDEIDGRTDLFALGATAFRILARRRVHESDSDAGLLLAMASRPAPALRSVAPHVSEELACIVDRALAFQRDARYPNALAMQADVRSVRSGAKPMFAMSRGAGRDPATRLEAATAAPSRDGVGGEPTRVAPRAAAGAAVSFDAPTVLAGFEAARAAAGLDTRSVAARYDAPTVAAGFDAPTTVARFDAPTVVAPARPDALTVLAPRSAPSTPQAAAAAQPSPRPSGEEPRRRTALALVAGFVVLGGLIWGLWPSSEGERASGDPAGAELGNTAPPASGVATQSNATGERAQRASQPRSKKEQEKARERQKKLEEAAREQMKKQHERRRGFEKGE